MKIIDYDNENYAIVIPKYQLEKVGFRAEDPFYLIHLDRGVIAIIRKFAFREALKDMVKNIMSKDRRNVPQNNSLSDLDAKEINLLVKIKGFSPEERALNNIKSKLSEAELELFESLKEKRLISVYKNDKFPEGIIFIARNVYHAIKSPTGEKSYSSSQSKGINYNSKRITSSSGVNIKAFVDKLNREGYVVLKSDSEARLVSDALRSEIKGGNIIGLRSFDKNYYIFKKPFYSKAQVQITGFLESIGEASLNRIAEGTGLPEEVCKGVLAMQLEEGDIIESKAGHYRLI